MKTHIALCCAVFFLACGCAPKIVVRKQPPRSNVPLVEAAGHVFIGSAYEQPASVPDLLSKGADVNQKDTRGRTALMEAAMANNYPFVKLLIEKGAKVDLKDGGGSTALLLACSNGNKESVRILLEHGADVNAENRWTGHTPLTAVIDNHITIEPGYPGAGKPVEFLETIKLLLKHGASVQTKVRAGKWADKTALQIATELNAQKTVALLEKAGAKN